jgi:hypothetical protein
MSQKSAAMAHAIALDTVASEQSRGIILRLSRQHRASIGAAFVAALLSLSVANAENTSDNMPWTSWADVFTKSLHDQTAISGQTDWSDVAALGYARSARSDAAAVRWLPQTLPAVDGINAKIDGFGGGANRSDGFYGASGSLAVPLARQWGLQLDAGIGSADGTSGYGGAGHVFWRDSSIGFLGAYRSYSHWNGTDVFARVRSTDGTIFDVNLGQISASTGRYAAEGEYYLSRWTLSGMAGVETVSINSTLLRFSVPNRFFDHVSAAYYVTDNFKLSAGHLYTFDTHFLTLGSEYGFALGGGRMAALFAQGLIGEGGNSAVLGGLRIYFGQHDKTLMERHRQDDPQNYSSCPLAEICMQNSIIIIQSVNKYFNVAKAITLGSEAAGLLFTGSAILEIHQAGKP